MLGVWLFNALLGGVVAQAIGMQKLSVIPGATPTFFGVAILSFLLGAVNAMPLVLAFRLVTQSGIKLMEMSAARKNEIMNVVLLVMMVEVLCEVPIHPDPLTLTP